MPVSMGIEKFDELLNGGAPENSSILVIAPQEIGKLFSIHFLCEGLKKNEACIYITFASPPNDVRAKIEEFSCRDKPYLIIDAFSWQLGIREGKYLVNPANLTTFNILIARAIAQLKEKNLKRIIIEYFSVLFRYVPRDLCMRFLALLLRQFKSLGITQLVVVDRLSEVVLGGLNALADITVEFEEKEKTVKIHKIKENPILAKFELTEKGIKLFNFVK
jgi:KaiC/GvpD/RAD55 family RecA-like ATPase